MTPVRGPQKQTGEPDGPKMGGQKAAQDAAHAASDMTQHAKARDPAFPKNAEMTNWTYYLGTAAVVSGCYGDEKEVTWLRECWSKCFDELECSDLFGLKDQL